MPNPAGRAVEAESRSLVFQTLQPIFSRLLSDTEDAVKVTGVLTSALDVLERDLLLRGHLHLCLDYALFPFQFLLPSIAATRQSGARKGATCAVPAMASHVAAEKTLQCFRTILQLAPPETSAQLSTVATLLGELTHVSAGSTYGAEACLHVLQSARAALRPVAEKRGTIVSAEMQPTLGYLIHGLLGVVEAEQKGAGFGDPTLMAHALRAATTTVAAATRHAGLSAFLLPGITCKVCAIVVQQPGVRKAPNAAIAAAVRLLSVTLRSALQPTGLVDASTADEQSHSQRDATKTLSLLKNAVRPPGEGTAATTTQPVASHGGAAPAADASFTVRRDREWVQGTLVEVHRALALAVPPLCTHAASSVRTALSDLLADVLSEVCTVLDAPSLQLLVRAALQMAQSPSAAASARCGALFADVAGGCSKSLRDHTAADAAQECERTGGSDLPAQRRRRETLQRSVESLVPDLLDDFKAARARPEGVVTAAAQRLAAALRALPPRDVCTLLLSTPAGTAECVEAVAAFVEVDESMAALSLQGHASQSLLRARLGPAATPADSITEARGGSAQRSDERTGATAAATAAPDAEALAGAQGAHECSSTAPDAEALARTEGTHEGSSAAHVSGGACTLRTQWLGMKYLSSEQVYRAVAEVPASLGAACAAAQADALSSSASVALVEYIRQELEGCAPRPRRRKHEASSLELGPCLLRQTQLMTTLCELLRGFARGVQACQVNKSAPSHDGQPLHASAASEPTQAISKDALETVEAQASVKPAAAAADDVMAQLDAEADAALARDFADLWSGALHDVQASVGEDVDLSWLGSPTGGTGLRSLSDQGDAKPGGIHPAEGTAQATTEGAEGVEDTSEVAQPEGFWASLTLGVRSILRSVTAVLDLAAATDDTDTSHARDEPRHDVGAVLHARACCTLVATLAEAAPEVLRLDEASLRAVLLPVLQCSASPSAAVSARAVEALERLCAGLNCNSWADLILANMDYVVDGLVLQLQQPERYPAAAPLLATLLRNASVGPTLLPALYEPASCAIQNLSILSRRARPQHTAAFLAAVLPIVRATQGAGAALDAGSQAQAADVAATLARQHAAFSSEMRNLAAGDELAQMSRQGGEDAAPAAPAADAAPGGAQEFFTQHHGGEEGLAAGGAAERRERASRVALSGAEREALDARIAQVAAASDLAAAAAQAAAPLLLAPELAVAVAASALVSASLRALAALTAVSDRDANEICEHLAQDARPPPPEAEKLLPVVHTTWGFMLQGLAPHGVAGRIEAAAALLADVMELAGTFVARRFEKEALPALERLMRGTAALRSRSGGGGGGGGDEAAAHRLVEEGTAAGTRARRQLAALQCVAVGCESGEGRGALVASVERVATGALQCLRDPADARVAEGALRCLRALGRVDPDAVWLACVEVLHSQRPELLESWAGPHKLCGLDAQARSRGAGTAQGWGLQCLRVLEEVADAEVPWHAVVRNARAARQLGVSGAL